MHWVRPGVELVFTSFLRFNNLLISADFPTFERPAKAISGSTEDGYWERRTAVTINEADFIFMGLRIETCGERSIRTKYAVSG